MQRLLFALAFLFVFTGVAAQKKKDNTVIIITTDSPEVAYKKIASILQDKGYTLDKSDKDLLSVSTTQKEIKRATMKVSAYVRPGDTTMVYLSGQSALPGTKESSSQVFYGGMKGSPMALSWIELQNIASKYPNGVIQYFKKD